MHKSKESAQQYFRSTSAGDRGESEIWCSFPTPSVPCPALENSQLLSSNHPVCEQVAGTSTATSGRGQRKLPNLPWDEMNTAHFLTYKYIEKGWKNTAEDCHTTHSLLQSACYRQPLQHHSSPPGQRPLTPTFLEFSK